jgi:MFS family permease
MILDEAQPFDEKNFSIFRYRPVMLMWFARVFTALAYQMQAVAVGWQIYELTSSPFLLGMVGLMMFIPGVLLVLVVGQVSDRFNRSVVIRIAQAVEAAAVGVLAITTLTGTVSVPLMMACVLTIGAGRAFESAILQALPPSIVPPSVLPRTIAGLSAAYQAASVIGPAVGGVLLILGNAWVYVTCFVLFLASSTFIWLIRIQHTPPKREPVTLATLFAGINFIAKNPIVLGAMSLDLFAVVFGGATALLPIFARDIFHVDEWGFGIMRAMPAIGALTVSFALAHFPIRRNLGRVMFGGVAMFGLSTILFGLSTSFPLSLFFLFMLGASDMFSVVVRQPLIQLETPDSMRGRVSAVNSLFIGTSNQIGEFESGVTAAWFGTVPAVVIGGAGTLLIVAIWIKVFKPLYDVHTFEQRYKN